MTLATRDGVIRGMFMLGHNPTVGGHNAALVQRGLAELDWLVVRDMTETETASFWYAGRPVRDREIRPARHWHRGPPDAGRAVRREGRLDHQNLPPAAVARQSGQRAVRQPLRDLVHVSSRPSAEAALRRQYGPPRMPGLEH
jgi:hypothetical protein